MLLRTAIYIPFEDRSRYASHVADFNFCEETMGQLRVGLSELPFGVQFSIDARTNDGDKMAIQATPVLTQHRGYVLIIIKSTR